MLRQSPLPNLARPSRKRRCSSSVQGTPLRRSPLTGWSAPPPPPPPALEAFLSAGPCGVRHVIHVRAGGRVGGWVGWGRGRWGGLYLGRTVLPLVLPLRAPPPDPAQLGAPSRQRLRTGPACRGKLVGKGIRPASIFLRSSCGGAGGRRRRSSCAAPGWRAHVRESEPRAATPPRLPPRAPAAGARGAPPISGATEPQPRRGGKPSRSARGARMLTWFRAHLEQREVLLHVLRRLVREGRSDRAAPARGIGAARCIARRRRPTAAATG